MSYEGSYLKKNTCIRESSEEVAMILRLAVCTFCFFSFNFSPNVLQVCHSIAIVRIILSARTNTWKKTTNKKFSWNSSCKSSFLWFHIQTEKDATLFEHRSMCKQVHTFEILLKENANTVNVHAQFLDFFNMLTEVLVPWPAFCTACPRKSFLCDT